jgi:hypothetical protein
LGVDNEIYHDKWLFLWESLLELHLHSILPIINDNFLRSGSLGNTCLNCRVHRFATLNQLFGVAFSFQWSSSISGDGILL